MANMDYCKFQNTLSDLRDCQDSLDEDGLVCEDDSEREAACRKLLVHLCGTIWREFSDGFTLNDGEDS